MDYEPHVIELQNANLVILKAKKGYIMCSLLDIETAEKLDQAAAIVTGVRTAEEAIKAKIKKATTKAKKLGIKEGMTAEEALKLLT